ncbi:MAG TPA: putative DNA-binding protein [Bacilli bacterium]
MNNENVLEKTNRINLLFDFYEPLLTEKQKTFMKYYFQDNYSLGEIASEFGISRQAIYEHIKRSEFMLEEYEHKLKLLAKHEQRLETAALIELIAADLSSEQGSAVKGLLQQIVHID